MEGKILIVEDEKELRDVISLFLRSEGFSVLEAENGETALAIFQNSKPDLIILDIMLPDISGFDICRKIRETSDASIIFLTALSGDDYYMIGYQAGADDYIAKPFKASIIAMKAKRMIRKTMKEEKHVVRIQGVILDENAHTCMVDNNEIILTQREFMLLTVFMKHPNRVLTREYLLGTIWGYDFEGETRVVDTMVTKLRKKLGPASAMIKTVISVGYKLEENV